MNLFLKRLAALPLALSAVVAVAPLSAQTTTPPPATCSVAPTSLQSLSIERVLTIPNVLTTITPTIDTMTLAAITSGAREIRERLVYNSQANTITSTVFLVASGSPNPTPLAVDITGQTVQTSTMTISQVFTSCKPVPSLLVVGTLTAASAGLFGSAQGAPVAISVGYTTDTPAKINNVVEVYAGQVLAYSASANGALTFPAAPVTPPGSTSGAPVIVLNPVPPTSGSFQAFQNPFYVDASGTTDPNNLSITYSWSADKPLNFVPNNMVANPNLQFVSGKGDYTITVTATNSAGVAKSQTFV